MEGNGQPVTRAELREALSEFEKRIDAKIDAKLDANMGLMREMLQDMETKLLNAFFGYQEHMDIRFRKITADVSNINASSELRVNNLEQRVIKLEQHWLRGPHPPNPEA